MNEISHSESDFHFTFWYPFYLTNGGRLFRNYCELVGSDWLIFVAIESRNQKVLLLKIKKISKNTMLAVCFTRSLRQAVV